MQEEETGGEGVWTEIFRERWRKPVHFYLEDNMIRQQDVNADTQTLITVIP